MDKRALFDVSGAYTLTPTPRWADVRHNQHLFYYSWHGRNDCRKLRFGTIRFETSICSVFSRNRSKIVQLKINNEIEIIWCKSIWTDKKTFFLVYPRDRSTSWCFASARTRDLPSAEKKNWENKQIGKWDTTAYKTSWVYTNCRIKPKSLRCDDGSSRSNLWKIVETATPTGERLSRGECDFIRSYGFFSLFRTRLCINGIFSKHF